MSTPSQHSTKVILLSSWFSIKMCFPICCSSPSSLCNVLTSVHYSTTSHISVASMPEPHAQLEQEKLIGSSPSPSLYFIHSGGKINRCQACLNTNERIFLTLRTKPKLYEFFSSWMGVVFWFTKNPLGFEDMIF